MNSAIWESSASFPHQFDVLIIGGGAAGLYAALCLPPHLQVGLITKDRLTLSASDWAQGGIAAVIDPQDSPTLHIRDTLQAGAGLCEPAAVDFLVHNAPDCIQRLVELGVAFDRDTQGNLALTLEAAHSRRRVLHAADTTGRAVVATLAAQVLNRNNIQVLSEAFVLNLWLEPQTHPQADVCQGVSLVYGDRLLWVSARAVILATGGGGQVFSQTTNPEGSTGDGVAIAWRAGAEVRDLEFVQFHPTALTQPGAPRFLISEAVRGEGAYLVDVHGHRFAFDYHPQGELAPRDVVSRAIYSHLQTLAHHDPTCPPQVYLDLRSIDAATIRHRFPNIIQVCQQWGIDPFQEPIPVAPAAHYWMGGITTDVRGKTSIPGLYALGETASTGVHGANRLASNSLLECLVFGQQMAELDLHPTHSSIQLGEDVEGLRESLIQASTQTGAEQWTIIQSIRQELPQLMWQGAGICRQSADLQTAIAQVTSWQHMFTDLPLSQVLMRLQPSSPVPLTNVLPSTKLRLWGETQNLLEIADLILKSALFRTESRGGHYRLDYPQPDPHWQVHTLIQGDRLWKSPLIAQG